MFTLSGSSSRNESIGIHFDRIYNFSLKEPIIYDGENLNMTDVYATIYDPIIIDLTNLEGNSLEIEGRVTAIRNNNIEIYAVHTEDRELLYISKKINSDNNLLYLYYDKNKKISFKTNEIFIDNPEGGTITNPYLIEKESSDIYYIVPSSEPVYFKINVLEKGFYEFILSIDNTFDVSLSINNKHYSEPVNLDVGEHIVKASASVYSSFTIKYNSYHDKSVDLDLDDYINVEMYKFTYLTLNINIVEDSSFSLEFLEKTSPSINIKFKTGDNSYYYPTSVVKYFTLKKGSYEIVIYGTYNYTVELETKKISYIEDSYYSFDYIEIDLVNNEYVNLDLTNNHTGLYLKFKKNSNNNVPNYRIKDKGIVYIGNSYILEQLTVSENYNSYIYSYEYLFIPKQDVTNILIERR